MHLWSRLEIYTKQPGSSPSILVNGSEKPNIHSQKSVLRLSEAAVEEYWRDILLEAVCSLSIAHVISIEHVIGRLRVSVHWRVTIWNKQTKSTFFGRYLFFSDNHLSNYTKTIIRLKRSKYWWIFPSTSSRGIFNNIYFAFGE